MKDLLPMRTYGDICDRHTVTLPAHLEAQAEIPVLSGPQRQGDLFVLPMRSGAASGEPISRDGIAVVRGEAGGNTHLLTGEGDIRWRALSTGGQDLGVLTVGEGAVAYLLHPEHGAQGIGPGEYIIRRQREMADEIRVVAD